MNINRTRLFNIFFIDNLFVQFDGIVFQQAIGIPMGTYDDPLFTDLFQHAYDEDFLIGLLKNKDRELAQTFNFRFRYIDNVLSLNNSRFGDYLHLICPNELEVTGTTCTQLFPSYLDIHLDIDTGGRLRKKQKLYDKRDAFTITIVDLFHQ